MYKCKKSSKHHILICCRSRLTHASRVSKERFFCLIKSLSDLQSSIVSVGGVLRIIRPNTCFALTNPSPRFILPNYARINETSEKSRRSYMKACWSDVKQKIKTSSRGDNSFVSIFVYLPSAPHVIKICCVEQKKIDENEAAMESAARLIPMLRDFI